MVIYLILINATGFVFMLTDKHRAIRNQYRIPERVLFAIALLGGSLGCIIGMHLFHHKTRKSTFSVGLPVLLALQILLAVILIQ